MQLKQQLLKQITPLLGNNFVCVSCEKSKKYGTNEYDGYKILVSIQDPSSPIYFDLIQVKVKNLTPSISSESIENIQNRKLNFSNLTMGIYNSDFTFYADDFSVDKMKRKVNE